MSNLLSQSCLVSWDYQNIKNCIVNFYKPTFRTECQSRIKSHSGHIIFIPIDYLKIILREFLGTKEQNTVA